VLPPEVTVASTGHGNFRKLVSDQKVVRVSARKLGLTDKFGVPWQIVPVELGAMLQDKEAGKADRVMTAMMKMIKLDLKSLRDAYENKAAG
jgi:predicted 3-demethylubiquinone-9 3-methyltransferase (glyoxalase superfamily)